MSFIHKLITCLTLAATPCIYAHAQSQQADTINNSIKAKHILTQNVHGIVVDAESKQPLEGILVIVVSNPQLNATTDSNGRYTISNVPVGRQSFQFRFTGYDTYTASEIPVITGKELELNAVMTERLTKLNEVSVVAAKDKIKPINEYATVSARTFSMEETRRYAASFSDPARMVMNYPGVSSSSDGQNSIVVHGNSPKGVLWRMEGIEIPNPNHFTSQGASGGAISMLNANTLGNSDFYTGAFVPEIGNALSGAFDLNLRNGNTEHHEYTVQVGALGVELATEGPFSKKSNASYIVNYRYSTLALLQSFLDLGGVLPKYQDGSFKVNLPTNKAGTFTLWGLGGYNIAYNNPEADSSKWTDDKPNVKFNNKNYMMVGGISHQYFINKNGYIKTIISASKAKGTNQADTLNPGDSYANVPVQYEALTNTAIRATVMYNQKLSARNSFRTGVIVSRIGYDLSERYFDDNQRVWKDILNGNGSTQFYQAYIQWKTRVTDRLSVVGGLHASYLALNSKYSIEPRLSAAYQLGKNRFTAAAGIHSKPEEISTYLFQNAQAGQAITYPNKNLDLEHAMHTVLGYETTLPGRVRLKLEAYYQYLYKVPVEQDNTSGFSIINAEDVYSLLSVNKPLVSEGKGHNYGIDISFERPFANNYYILATGSVFKSNYTTYGGQTYDTRYDRGVQLNLIGGKEFKLNTSGRKLIGLNGKIVYTGGQKESLIDLAQSRITGKTEYVAGQYFTQQGPAYFRLDGGIYYKINNKRATHTIQLDIQNITNRQNYFISYYDNKSGNIKTINQIGFFPNILYRVDFHW